MAVSGFLMQTGLPRGPSRLSYFCFCSPVLSPGDRDRNRLRSLPAWRSSRSGVGEVLVSAWGLSLGQLPLGLVPQRPRSLALRGACRAARPRRECLPGLWEPLGGGGISEDSKELFSALVHRLMGLDIPPCPQVRNWIGRTQKSVRCRHWCCCFVWRLTVSQWRPVWVETHSWFRTRPCPGGKGGHVEEIWPLRPWSPVWRCLSPPQKP